MRFLLVKAQSLPNHGRLAGTNKSFRYRELSQWAISAAEAQEAGFAAYHPLKAFFPSRSHRKGMAKSVFAEYSTLAVS
jgi:hypothetical protein